MLIVHEEELVHETCRPVAEQLGFLVFSAENISAAMRHLSTRPVDLVLLEAGLNGSGPRETIAAIRAVQPQADIVLAGHNGRAQAVLEAVRIGACDFLRRPFKDEELRRVLHKVADRRVLADTPKTGEGAADRTADGGVVGQSPEVRRLYRIIERTASSRHPVLIVGEKGSGKAKMARLIHASGIFRDRPFVEIDCASWAPPLLEARLFGSASSSEPPALASGGTVFLEAIGEVPLNIQGRLLRALQEKEIRPAGNGKPLTVDVRVIAATVRDLETAVQQGVFRRDLYLRLNVVALRLPPLRERRDDIRTLAEHILRNLSAEKGVRYSIAPEAMKLMMAYNWPGNMRELENALYQAVCASTGSVLGSAHLPAEIQAATVPSDISPSEPGRIVPLAEVERKAILDTLNLLNGNKQMAAQMLGIGKTTLYRKLKEYGIGRRSLDRYPH